MNGKTARLLQKISLAQGKKLKELKVIWKNLESSERYRLRREYEQTLTSSKKK